MSFTLISTYDSHIPSKCTGKFYLLDLPGKEVKQMCPQKRRKIPLAQNASKVKYQLQIGKPEEKQNEFFPRKYSSPQKALIFSVYTPLFVLVEVTGNLAMFFGRTILRNIALPNLQVVVVPGNFHFDAKF